MFTTVNATFLGASRGGGDISSVVGVFRRHCTWFVFRPQRDTRVFAAAQGGNGAIDSDGSGAGNCKTIVLADGETNLDITDCSHKSTASLGDFVWFDANGDEQDVGEPGIDGATVTLAGQAGPQSTVTTAGGAAAPPAPSP